MPSLWQANKVKMSILRSYKYFHLTDYFSNIVFY